MERQIVHCDLDTFFVSVERLKNSALIGQPVIIGGHSPRSVVASCSYEARRYGVHSAMPMHTAKKLCPEAIIIAGNMDSYSHYSALVSSIISSKAPLVEKASIDEHYLDLSGMDKYLGAWQWTQELRQYIMKESGLPISFALANCKAVAKIATGQAKPCGALHIAQGTEKEFLAPLSIKKIPMIGEKTYQQLRLLGIHKIAQIQQLEAGALQRLLGQNGLSIWKKAQGIDDSPVVPFKTAKSKSKEHTYPQDISDKDQFKKTLLHMASSLAFELRNEGRMACSLSIKIRYANFETFSKQLKINPCANEKIFFEKAWGLLETLYNPQRSLRLIGLKLGDTLSGSYQADLFSNHITELNLTSAMDKIKKRFGNLAVMRAACL